MGDLLRAIWRPLAATLFHADFPLVRVYMCVYIYIYILYICFFCIYLYLSIYLSLSLSLSLYIYIYIGAKYQNQLETISPRKSESAQVELLSSRHFIGIVRCPLVWGPPHCKLMCPYSSLIHAIILLNVANQIRTYELIMRGPLNRGAPNNPYDYPSRAKGARLKGVANWIGCNNSSFHATRCVIPLHVSRSLTELLHLIRDPLQPDPLSATQTLGCPSIYIYIYIYKYAWVAAEVDFRLLHPRVQATSGFLLFDFFYICRFSFASPSGPGNLGFSLHLQIFVRFTLGLACARRGLSLHAIPSEPKQGGQNIWS